MEKEIIYTFEQLIDLAFQRGVFAGELRCVGKEGWQKHHAETRADLSRELEKTKAAYDREKQYRPYMF